MAPVVALLIRQAVSRQREFLADADAALLTQNPEGLALALVKIGEFGGERLRVGEGTVHLCFVDLRSQSWTHLLFPSHPPLEARIELLARMGNGIARSAIEAARAVGLARRQAAEDAADDVETTAEAWMCHVTGPEFQSMKSVTDEISAQLPSSPCDATAPSIHAAGSPGFDGFVRLYNRPVEGSRLLSLLPEDASVRVDSIEGDFVQITTEDGLTGFVFRSAPLRMQPAAAPDQSPTPPPQHPGDALTPLYEQADGWSRVLAQLPASAVITPIASEGHFIRVTTAEHQVGYVSRSAPLTVLKNFRQ